ncbi:MerR family transcriptional regulator [Martelella alba]|uniref:MerR family transcriptional regulator n=1 Tax=Martelella alba TaxID=2590451 RepID=A0A506UFU9_9HYPH|nr:MerR family transcriptional regulator [Martelella alba]TPW32201.1 MerR family transcriptional regulator [Martelella alba]
MKIGALARHCGLSVHTIRYYEQIGLLPPAVRDRSGHRDYDETVLTWIAFLNRLKETGMPISEMLRYAEWRQKGDATIGERLALLEAHRESVAAKIRSLQQSLDALDDKIKTYATMRERTTNDDK